MLNALNESAARRLHHATRVAGIGRWNQVIEKAGHRRSGSRSPHKAFNRKIGTLAAAHVVARRPRRRRGGVGGARARVAADAGGPRVRRLADGPRRRAGQVRQLDRAAGARHQQAAGRLRVRAVRLTPMPQARRCHGDEHARSEVIRQHLIDPEICIRCNTCEETCPVDAITHDARNYVVDADDLQRLQRVHLALPDRRDRQLAPGRERARRTRSTSSSAWDTLPAQQEVDDGRRRDAAAPRSRGITARRDRGPGRHCAPPPWSAAHPVRQPLHAREAGDRDGHRQLPADRRRRVERHPPHRARLRRASRSRCSRARRSASCRRAPTRRAGRIIVRLYSSRARATASGRATTTSR